MFGYRLDQRRDVRVVEVEGNLFSANRHHEQP
jgi:hypothetical protein